MRKGETGNLGGGESIIVGSLILEGVGSVRVWILEEIRVREHGGVRYPLASPLSELGSREMERRPVSKF